jgi:hypothetical protein
MVIRHRNRCVQVICLVIVVMGIRTLVGAESRDPIAWWKFDGRAESLTDKINNLKLIPKEGRDGYNDNKIKKYLETVSPSLDMGTSDFSLEVTFRLDKYPLKNGFLIAKGNKNLGGWYYVSILRDGQFCASLNDDEGNGGEARSSHIKCKIGKWYHLVATFDRHDKLCLYVNGNLAGLNPTIVNDSVVGIAPNIAKVGNIDNTDTFKIGMLWNQYFDGVIEEVRIYKHVLTRKEVQENLKEVISRHQADDFPFTGRRVATSEFKWRIITSEEAGRVKGIRKGNLLHDSSFESLKNIHDTGLGSKWWTRSGGIVSKDAYHGDCAVTGFVESDFYRFRPDMPLTFSFYARAPEGGRTTVTIRHGYSKVYVLKELPQERLWLEKKFDVGKNWQCYHFSFMPGAHPGTDLQHLFVKIQGSSGMIFDALQLEEGGLTEYNPGKVELFVNIPRREATSNVTLFFDGEEIPVECILTGNEPGELETNLIVRDFWMKERYRRKIVLRIPKGKVSVNERIAITGLPRGAYRVHLESGSLKSRSMIFGVIGKELGEGSEICGGSHATGMNHNRAFIEALGLTWTRHHAAYWGRSIASNGSFFWPREDAEVAQKKKAEKLRFWGSFIYPPAPWDDEKTMHWRDWSKPDEPLPEKFLTGMEEYLRAAVPHFKDTIKYWECWNEPGSETNGKYLQMLKRFYKVVKECDPDAKVVGFAGFMAPGYWEKFYDNLVERGALKYCDVVSYHGYNNNWPEDPIFSTEAYFAGKSPALGDEKAPTFSYYLDELQERMKKEGEIKPIWDDEFALWGGSWYADERTPEAWDGDVWPEWLKRYSYKDGVSMIVHYVTIGYSHGVRHFGPHCFDHEFAYQGQSTREFEEEAFDYDRSIRPKTIAYAVVCHKMNDARLVKESISKDLFTYVFDKPEGSLAVVFTRHAKKVTIILPAGSDLTVKDVFDAPFHGKIGRKGMVLNLPGEPIYLESGKNGKELVKILEQMDVKW